jgi:hypothetical protein
MMTWGPIPMFLPATFSLKVVVVVNGWEGLWKLLFLVMEPWHLFCVFRKTKMIVVMITQCGDRLEDEVL